MRVVLVNPPSQERTYGKLHKHLPPFAPPLGILYLAAVLEENKIPVFVVDAYGENYDLKTTCREIVKLKPDIVGYTVLSLFLGPVLKIAKAVKRKLPSVLNVVGGPHITALPAEILSKYPFLDVAISKEGEKAFLEIAQEEKFKKIAGIAYRGKGGKVVLNPQTGQPINIDKLPFPARHLIDLTNYHHALFESYGKPLTTVITSRGCPNRCTFCSSQVTFGRKVRFRSIENVMEEIDLLIRDYNIKAIEFRDDTFTLDKERVLNLCRELKKRHLVWIVNARVDTVDEEMVKAMKNSGCKLLQVGVESGSQKILDEYCKGIKLEQIKKAFSIFSRQKIDTMAFFIFGASLETPKTAEETITLAKELNPTFVEFFILNPLPGSSIYESFSKKGLMKKFSWEDIYSPQFFAPIINHPCFSGQELVNLVSRGYKELYLRPAYILRTLLKINSFAKFRTYCKMFPIILKLS